MRCCLLHLRYEENSPTLLCFSFKLFCGHMWHKKPDFSMPTYWALQLKFNICYSGLPPVCAFMWLSIAAPNKTKTPIQRTYFKFFFYLILMPIPHNIPIQGSKQGCRKLGANMQSLTTRLFLLFFVYLIFCNDANKNYQIKAYKFWWWETACWRLEFYTPPTKCYYSRVCFIMKLFPTVALCTLDIKYNLWQVTYLYFSFVLFCGHMLALRNVLVIEF